MRTSNAPSLIVPMNVAALCVGNTDVNGSNAVPYGTKDFARVAADFSKVPYLDADQNPVNAGANVTETMLSQPFDPVLAPLAQGIHLHWALPDAVSHGVSDAAGAIAFPEAPNRWLVVRIAVNTAVAAGPVTSVKGWIVESDQLWDPSTQPASGGDLDIQNAQSGYVPTQPSLDPGQFPNQSSQTMGRVYAYEAWSETDGGTYIAKHTALGYGVPSYAAAYAHCQNVFGLYDPLTDLDPGAFPPASTQISYMVAGWYSDPANDPLARVSYPSGLDNIGMVEVLQKKYKWTFAIDDGAPFPASTLCNGLLTAITWDPDVKYINPRPDTELDVAIGNTTAEALSALIASRPQFASLPNVERVLNALQLGLLSKLGASDGLAKLDEAIHQNDFGSTNAGTIWMVKKAGAGDSVSAKNPVTGADQLSAAGEAPLDPQLASTLNALNIAQAGCDKAAFEIETLRGQIFVDWYKYMVAEYPTSDQSLPITADAIFHYVKAEVATLKARIAALATAAADVTARADALRGKLGKAYTLASITTPRYWQAGEPVLLLAGEDVQPSYRHGADGRLDPNGYLLCRLSTALVTAMTVPGTSYDVTAPMLPRLPSSPNTAYAGILAALMGEAFFLDPQRALVLAGAVAALGGANNPAVSNLNGFAAGIQAAQSALMVGGAGPSAGTVSFAGTAPSPIGVDAWSAPWIPLLMQWEAEYYPFETVGANTAGATTYPSNFITANFTLDGDAIDLAYGQPVPSGLPLPQVYRGTALLTHNTEINIRTQIDKYLVTNPGDPNGAELRAISVGMRSAMMAQTLDGFNEALMMRRQTLQLKVYDPLAIRNGLDHFRFSNVLVRDAVGAGNNFAPMPLLPYNPLRAGYMSIGRVRIIDAFGQIRDLASPPVVRSEMLMPAGDNPAQPVIGLPPRMTQPSRLLFRWLSADDDLVEMNSDPASSPVCGWVLFNHLDDSLMIYDAGGNALGSLNVQGPIWQGAPGDPTSYGKPAAQALAGANAHLQGFVLGVIANPNPRAFLADMLAAIDRTATMVEPGNYREDQGLAVLIGRPLALVRASLGMELKGLPAIDQSWNALAATVVAWESAGRPAADAGIANRGVAAFTDVRFPVRLGDLSQVDDGLIGYFVDDGSANIYHTFYAAASRRTANGVVPPAFDRLTVSGNDADPATLLTMLVDPRAVVHATTGFLPAKSIGIPPAMYSNALGRMAVTFLTAPVLTSTARLSIPVPKENGLAWSWVMNNPTAGAWDVNDTVADVNHKSAFAGLPQGISEGWLKLYAPDPASGTNNE